MEGKEERERVRDRQLEREKKRERQAYRKTDRRTDTELERSRQTDSEEEERGWKRKKRGMIKNIGCDRMLHSAQY